MQDVTTFKHTWFIMNINGHTFSSPDHFSKNFKFKKPATMYFLNLKINYCKRLDKNKNNIYTYQSVKQINAI